MDTKKPAVDGTFTTLRGYLSALTGSRVSGAYACSFHTSLNIM